MSKTYSAHVDTFSRDNLPPTELWPEFVFDIPEMQFPERMNCASILVDDAVREGAGENVAIYFEDQTWTYRDVQEQANKIAQVLNEDMGLVAGNRLLLRGPNNPMLFIAWVAAMKAGAVVVATMALLREKEIAVIIDKAEISHALCDCRFVDDVAAAQANSAFLRQTRSWGGGELESLMESKSGEFENVDTAADDVSLIGFTSGTTGVPKGTMHFHRDLVAISETNARYLLNSGPTEIFTGTPPLAFTFGLGGVLVFPFYVRAAAAPLEAPSPDALLEHIQRYGVTTIFSAPTAYKVMVAKVKDYDISSLVKCVSAGEPLPKTVSDAWYEATGIRITDALGATEMLHAFIGASGDDARPGATGKPMLGYEACVLDDDDQPMGLDSEGRLAVKGPTGCRYLADDRQKNYIVNGWNVTGDRYYVDADGYYWFKARADDMIISSGYNIAGPEVEAALLAHDAVAECAVVASPDPDRTNIVKAFIVLAADKVSSEELVSELQDFTKQSIAPYKYPRAIEFVDSLPKTLTGKLQRFALRDRETKSAG